LSTRTAARTGSLNNGGVTGMFCNCKISMSAIFKVTLLSEPSQMFVSERFYRIDRTASSDPVKD
jgi:hypothetical protein